MILTKKISFFLVLLGVIISTIPPAVISDNPSFIPSDINTLPYKQEITIPIDTSLPDAKYQPIDIRIQFDQTCWAVNETKHSVRVAYDDGSDLNELESQIYDLSHTDENHIDACSIVFLIPETANGKETYTVLFSNSETESPSYTDHLSIIDTHYYYEPISGQKMDFDYYQINEDEFIIYALCQRGELLGSGMSNAIIKLKPQSTEFKTTNAEQIASFYTTRSIDPAGEDMGTQWASDITKNILVDGNLMVRIQIKGSSPQGELQTDNIYSYYYCPNETKKLNVNVNHEALEDIQVKGEQEKEMTFSSLSTIKARSATINDMNLGEILPDVHFYREDDTIVEYDMPVDPDSDPAEWLLSYSDDQDLGSKAWLCIDDPSTGMAHGLIFDKNTEYIEGENDGIQIKTSVHQHVKLPGLEADTGDIYAMRNAYENGNHNTDIPKGTNVTFNVEYIAVQTGGYESIDIESGIYQTLIKERPIKRGNATTDIPPEEEKERYTLTASVHLEPSAPLGSLLSAGTGRNISYLSAELYKGNSLASSGSAGRLKLGDVNIEFADNATIVEKIKTVLGIFDIRNSTFFKTIRFPDLEEGTYLIKIFKENPFRSSDRKYVGFSIVDVTSDTKTRIFCKPETNIQVSINDQNDDAVKDSHVMVIVDDTIIAEETTDTNGTITLPIPLYTNKAYQLRTMYNGFVVSESEINLGFLNRWRTWTESIEMDLFSLQLHVKDTLGLPPAIETNPSLTSKEMIESQTITASTNEPGSHQFSLLYPASYNLKLSYKSFEYLDTISLSKDSSLDIVFPAEFPVNIHVYNTVGDLIDTATISLERENKGPSNDLKDGVSTLTVPPGTYLMSVETQDLIAQQRIDVKGDRTVDIVSSQDSSLHSMAPIAFIVLGALLLVFLWWKKQLKMGIYLFIILLIAASLLQPWWQLTGDNGTVTTTTNTRLYPASIITMTSSTDTIGGEISAVPEEFTMVIEIISYILILSIIVIVLSILIKSKWPKISSIVNILAIVFLLLSAILFYVAMSEVTKVGVGDFFGSGDLPISIPGESDQVTLSCSWGAGFGMYTALLAFLVALFEPLTPLLKKMKTKILG